MTKDNAHGKAWREIRGMIEVGVCPIFHVRKTGAKYADNCHQPLLWKVVRLVCILHTSQLGGLSVKEKSLETRISKWRLSSSHDEGPD